MPKTKRDWARIVGKSVFYASIQAAIGSVEMSSKFSVLNFSKDQQTLQRAADALRNYLIIAVIWTLGTVATMYANYGLQGAIVGLVANLVMILWIYISYILAFRSAAKENNLKIPYIFFP